MQDFCTFFFHFSSNKNWMLLGLGNFVFSLKKDRNGSGLAGSTKSSQLKPDFWVSQSGPTWTHLSRHKFKLPENSFCECYLNRALQILLPGSTQAFKKRLKLVLLHSTINNTCFLICFLRKENSISIEKKNNWILHWKIVLVFLWSLFLCTTKWNNTRSLKSA